MPPITSLEVLKSFENSLLDTYDLKNEAIINRLDCIGWQRWPHLVIPQNASIKYIAVMFLEQIGETLHDVSFLEGLDHSKHDVDVTWELPHYTCNGFGTKLSGLAVLQMSIELRSDYDADRYR